MAVKRVTVRTLILKKLSQRPYRPTELLQELQRDDVSESALRDELAELFDEHIVELSPDRHIKLRVTDRVASAAR